ncbi:hypothetical protein KKC60_00820 [Patescibacteria group bacterium]|nr:hypothetical protein [Patescibacteria group bacterium]
MKQRVKTIRKKIGTLESKQLDLEEKKTKMSLKKTALDTREGKILRKSELLEEKEVRLYQWDLKLRERERKLRKEKTYLKTAAIDYNKWREIKGIRKIRCVIPLGARNRDIGETLMARKRNCYYYLGGHSRQTKCRIDMTWTCTHAKPTYCGVTMLATCKGLPWAFKGRSQRRGKFRRYRFPAPWRLILTRVTSF